ncbi:MAG: hypothetical protein QM791_21145 [Ferruginibacter sp.]
MKHLLLIISTVCAVAFAKAQIINIPDVNFKKQLIEKFDINNDGELQNNEALAIEELNIKPVRYNASNECGYVEIWPEDYTGIEKFTNLQKFYCVCYYPTMFSDKCASGPATPTRNLSFKNNTNLKVVSYTGDTAFSHIDLSGCSNLDSLVLSGIPNGDDSRASAGLNSNFDNLDLSGNHKLRYAFISYFLKLKNFNVNGCDSLKNLMLYTCGVKNLDIHGLPVLEQLLVISYHYPDFSIKVNVTNAPSLKLIGVSWPDITGINLSGCDSLSSLNITGEKISAEHLDFSGLPALKILSLYSQGGKLSYLNIKNGSLTNLSTYVTPALQYICADDFEVDALRQLFNSMRQHVNINPYCNFGPAGNYNTITGTARLSLTGAVCDAANPLVKNMPVKIQDDKEQYVLSYTDITGNYKTYTGKGDFKLVPYFPYAYFNVNPASTVVSFDTANSLIAGNDFCITPDGVHDDLEITLLPWMPSRPGFANTYQLAYKNRGTTTLSGNVQLNFDNNKMTFTSASANAATQSTGHLTWNYNALQPFESRTINVTFNLLPPPVNNIDDTLLWFAAITPVANDETAFDNSFILPQKLVGAFDPNDKQCLEGSKLDISKIGQPLHYIIRFQNEGTDTAFNVVVADTLGANLNANSFEFTGSSHPCKVKQNDNKLEFIFENIKLPYKAIDEPGSHGFVAFSIKPKSSVIIGDSIKNKAAIYFDFNLPVITNTAATVVSIASTPVPVKLEYFSAVNRNNVNALTWKVNCSDGKAIFSVEKSADGIHFSSIGTITADAASCQLPFNFADNETAVNKIYYRLRITDAAAVSFYSKIISVGINKGGFAVNAVTSAGNNTVIYFASSKQQKLQYKIIAADGRLLYEGKNTVAAGTGNITVPLKGVMAGIYSLIVFAAEQEPLVIRFLK